MKIEVEISDSYVTILSKWASVQRTLSEAIRLLDELMPKDNPDLTETINVCASELEDIGPAISHLHMQCRTQIWLQQEAAKRGA